MRSLLTLAVAVAHAASYVVPSVPLSNAAVKGMVMPATGKRGAAKAA
jgi:hypothetical protein